MAINWNVIKAGFNKFTISTKAAVAAVATGTSLMQIQEVRDFVIKHTVGHPKIASLAAGILGVLTLLHNPTVQKILHIEQKTDIKLPGGGTTPATTTTDAEVK